MSLNVENYIGEITTMAWNLGYETTIDDNNDLIIESRYGDPYSPTIYAKFMYTGSKLELGDSFWFNPEMTFPQSKIDFNEGSLIGFQSITESWFEASEIAETLIDREWIYDEEEV